MKSKVLIIENDTSTIQNISTLLKKEGYKTVQTINGFSGINKALKDKPDLIICNIMMPGLDDYKVKEVLKKNGFIFDIPLIFLTAKTEFKDLRYGIKLGANDYLFKPYRSKDLLEIINLRIKKKKQIVTRLAEQNSTNVKNRALTNDDSILVTLGNKTKFIKINSINYIQASNQYTNISLSNGNSTLIKKSLNYWMSILPANTFIRIHRSTIINLDYIKKIEKTSNNLHNIYLKGSSKSFALSRRYCSKIKNKLK